MSQMSNLELEISEMLEQGRDPQIIAQILEVPISWIYEVIESHCEQTVDQ